MLLKRSEQINHGLINVDDDDDYYLLLNVIYVITFITLSVTKNKL
jgi:hypothetical protein